MWFNQALIFEYELPKEIDLNTALETHELHPCPPHARFTYGWQTVLIHDFVFESNGAQLLRFGKEERILPRGVLKRLLAEKIEAIEAEKGRPLSRAEKSKMQEDLEFELLPKAFCLQKSWDILLDTSKQHLIFNSSSTTQASQMMSYLRKAIPGISITPLQLEQNLSPILTQWIYQPHTLPTGFSLAETCVLIDVQDEKRKLSCKGYDLNADEIKTLIDEGLAVSEVSLIWQDRISFTLTHDFVFKRMKCMDYLVDEFHDLSELEEEIAQQEAGLALLSGELRSLIGSLTTAIKTAVIQSPPHAILNHSAQTLQ